jgi:small neutral amino acid transporter SnatA (MarC family)
MKAEPEDELRCSRRVPVNTHYTPEETREAAATDDIALVPLGIPLVAGPGAISTIIIYAHQAANWLDTVFLIIASITDPSGGCV